MSASSSSSAGGKRRSKQPKLSYFFSVNSSTRNTPQAGSVDLVNSEVQFTYIVFKEA
jgi:hypothetical protein